MLMPGRQMNQGVNIPGATVSGNTVVNGYTVPVALSVSSRPGPLPSEYVASGNVEFSGEFESTVSDEFVAYISDAGYAGTGNLGAGLSGSGGSYRYGFNGKENDNEVKGIGNQQDYGMRIYDPKLGRFLSEDPLTKTYTWYTPYQFAGNKPIVAIDLDGMEEWMRTQESIMRQQILMRVDATRINSLSKVQTLQSTPYRDRIQEFQHEKNRVQQFQALGYKDDGTKQPWMNLADNKTFKNFSNNVAFSVT